MKHFLTILFASALIMSCSKDELDNCFTGTEQEDWMIERFKSDYNIMVPDTFEGTGITGFEGNIYSRNAPDSSVIAYYFFCSPLFCEDFGDELEFPFPDQLDIEFRNGNSYILDNMREICRNDEITSVLYYEDEERSRGSLFMNYENTWRHALQFEYNREKLDEVLEISASIMRR